jgi:excisionase family DNA binding protein
MGLRADRPDARSVWTVRRRNKKTLRREEGFVDTGDRLLTPGEVAALFRVDPKTVTRWAAAGRISSIRTPGGHRRFRESEVRALLEGEEGASEPTQQH